MSAHQQKLRLISGVLLPLFEELATRIPLLLDARAVAEGAGPIVAEYHQPGILLAGHASVLRLVRREDTLGVLAGPGRLVGHRRYLLGDGRLLVLDGSGRVGTPGAEREAWRVREDADGAAEADLRALSLCLSLQAHRSREPGRMLAASEALAGLMQTHAAMSTPEPGPLARVHSMWG